MTASIERGHFDTFRPTFRVALHQQAAPLLAEKSEEIAQAIAAEAYGR